MNASNQHFLKQLTQPAPSGFVPSLVRTNAEGWQITCWDLAKANQQFYLRGYKKPHQTFVEELAFTYQYHLERVGKEIVFHPNASPTQDRP